MTLSAAFEAAVVANKPLQQKIQLGHQDKGTRVIKQCNVPSSAVILIHRQMFKWCREPWSNWKSGRAVILINDGCANDSEWQSCNNDYSSNGASVMCKIGKVSLWNCDSAVLDAIGMSAVFSEHRSVGLRAFMGFHLNGTFPPTRHSKSFTLTTFTCRLHAKSWMCAYSKSELDLRVTSFRTWIFDCINVIGLPPFVCVLCVLYSQGTLVFVIQEILECMATAGDATWTAPTSGGLMLKIANWALN